MTFDQWIAHGIAQGWCGPAICDTHDGTPTTADEDHDFDNGHDPCIHIIRLYPDTETRDQVVANHPPSTWRNTHVNAKTAQKTHNGRGR